MSAPPPAARRLTGLAVLCWALGLLSVALPAWLIADELSHPRGPFRDLGIAIVLGALAPVLTLASFAANLIYARLRSWRVGRGLKAVLAVQALGLSAALALWGLAALEAHRDSRLADRRGAVYAAVERNDPVAIAQGFERCGADCADERDRLLLFAAEARAHRAIAALLALGARPASDSRAARGLRTCEGLYLPLLTALEISVARDDAEGVALLLPEADARARRRAAWIAAQLDRLELLQRLLDADVPLTLSGNILDENATLLNAAASGAALRVASWLLAAHGFDPNGLPQGSGGGRGETPLASLVRYASDVPDSERFAPFLRLLLARGAEMERISPATGKTALQLAVDVYALSAYEALVGAGASEAVLTPAERARLAQMRASPPPARHLSADQPNCVR
ncbi:hypothetical protein [Elioraea tepidiphila]|jgi:hypothetical protein|uniref:hypothetical protein n=1 Tax=Elioraea tepidiphila TaxID=457934 RepID=UPI002FD8BB4C